VGIVSPVRRGVQNDASAIGQRVADQLLRDSMIEPLISSTFSRPEFELALATTTSPLWVDETNAEILGHLYGATFNDPLYGRQTWSGPDGYSYDVGDVLDGLCAEAYREWRRDGSTAHVVWALAEHGTPDWTQRHYEIVSVRGALALDDHFDVTWSANSSLRRANVADIEAALSFDAMIDVAQGVQLDALTDQQRAANRDDLLELLEDPECRYYLVDVNGQPAAQCVTFPLPQMRGNFSDTMYLGSVAVSPSFRRSGLATTMLHAVLNEVINEGFAYVEVRWHSDNHAATSLWSSVGFRPTYVQLRRPLTD
jgi:ribosomal protein S18 acetylase RimI-like enzyme